MRKEICKHDPEKLARVWQKGEPMIEIHDTDLPITAAEKIITGTKPYGGSLLTKAVAKAITGSETAAESIDMFDIDEIKEIADYLMVYYESHKNLP